MSWLDRHFWPVSLIAALAFTALIFGLALALPGGGHDQRPVCGYDVENVPILVGKATLLVPNRVPVYCDEPAR